MKKQLKTLIKLQEKLELQHEIISDDISDGKGYNNEKHDMKITVNGETFSIELNADFQAEFEMFLRKAVKEEEEWVNSQRKRRRYRNEWERYTSGGGFNHSVKDIKTVNGDFVMVQVHDNNCVCMYKKVDGNGYYTLEEFEDEELFSLDMNDEQVPLIEDGKILENLARLFGEKNCKDIIGEALSLYTSK